MNGEQEILVLQGGGALGAYQAGAYQALAASGHRPAWIAGISIGAINAALIAGNAPEQRVDRLRTFWETVTAGTLAAWPGPVDDGRARGFANEASAFTAALFGRPGFFRPRLPPPLPGMTADATRLSFYDTTPLRDTLERLVDVDRLNHGDIRLSIGAVNVRTGNFAYFDTARQRVDIRHVMASGALPPGFPPVEIDGEHFWDGGLVSNTPLQYVLDQPGTADRLIYQVDLFSARGPLPADIAQVFEREKDIRYSSRTRMNTDQALHRQRLAQAARRLFARLPPRFADDPDLQLLQRAACERAVTVVHLINRRSSHQTHSKDYEFSRLTMTDLWASGVADVDETLRDSRFVARGTPRDGVHVFDLTTRGR